jgi:hypothetical protein
MMLLRMQLACVTRFSVVEADAFRRFLAMEFD